MSWNALSEEEKVISSHMPGWCKRGFEDWAACEDFLGFSVPNPLEDCDWLEKGTYAAMPLGFLDTPRVDTWRRPWRGRWRPFRRTQSDRRPSRQGRARRRKEGISFLDGNSPQKLYG